MKRIRRYFERRSKRLKFRRILSASMGCDVTYRGKRYWVGSTFIGSDIELINTTEADSVKINGSRLDDVILFITPEQARALDHIMLDAFSHKQIKRA